MGEIPVGTPNAIAELSTDGFFLLASDKGKNPTLAILSLITPKRITHKIQIGAPAKLIRIHQHIAAVFHQNPNQSLGKNQLTLIHIDTGLILQTIPIPFDLSDLTWSDNGELIFLSSAESSEISSYNLKTGGLMKTVDLSEHGVKVGKMKQAPDGKHLGVLMEYGNKLLILDNELHTLKETPTGEVPVDLSYNTEGSEIYVLLDRGKTIQIFNTQTLELTREIPLEEHCKHLRLTSEEAQKVLVTCPRSRTLYMFDPSSDRPTHTLNDPYTPWKIMAP